MRCTTTCTLIVRIGGVNPLTAVGANAFLPAMAFTYKLVNNVPTPIVGLTYFTDEGQSANKAVLRHMAFGITGSLRGSGALTVPQVVGPGGGDYWATTTPCT